MTKQFIHSSAVGILLACAAYAQPSQTAQSVQLSTEGLQAVYTIEGSETLSYNFGGKPAAVAAFDTYFTITGMSGGPTASQVETAKHKVFTDNACAFLKGTALAGQTVTFGARSVTITAKEPGIYDARTGWTVVDTSGGTSIDATVSSIFVASQSLTTKAATGKEPWTKKFSFDLGTTEASRVSGLKIELLKDNVVVETRMPSHAIVRGLDWTYSANAGTFGNATAQQSLVSDSLVSAILLADNFAGNNGAGGSQAQVPSQTFTVPAPSSGPANYTIRISGTVKGNAAVSDQTFSVTTSFVTILNGFTCQ
jgi:hypothetical protein